MTLTTFCASAFNLAMSGCSACAHSGAVKTSESPISSRFINSPRSLSVLYHTTSLGNPLHSSLRVTVSTVETASLLRHQHRLKLGHDAHRVGIVLGLDLQLFILVPQLVDPPMQRIDHGAALLHQVRA